MNVDNGNDLAAEGRVLIKAGGDRLGSERFTLAANSRQDVSVEFTLPSASDDYTPEASLSGVKRQTGGL